MPRKNILLGLALAAACTGAGPALGMPDKPIVLVNSYPPVGPAELAGSVANNKMLKIMQSFAAPSVTDVLADRVSLGMGVALDRIVTVERRSRGRSILGTRHVARSAPDGRTLLLSGSLEMVTYPRLFELPYAPLRDFAPVAAVARMPVVVIAAAEDGPQSLQAFVAAARAAPGALNYGSSGDFRIGHLAGELFRQLTGMAVVHVAYNGGHEALNGVLKKQVDIAFVPLPSVLPALTGGKFRLLAIADPERLETLPHVPTVSETGVRDFEAASWFGVFAPSATPGHIVARLNKAIVTGLKDTRSARLLLSYGLQAEDLSAVEFGDLIRAEHRKWLPVLGSLNPPF